jgi:undecaprenyl-diphosphatase
MFLFMAIVAQLVRAPDCGSGGRGFETRRSPFFFILHLACRGLLRVSLFQAIILGVLQGITEFFPISSSGHLKLAQALFGFENLSTYITFDLTCHGGTLLALFFVFRKTLCTLLTSHKKLSLLLFLALLPLGILYPFLSMVRAVYNEPHFLGGFFLITSLLLFLEDKVPHHTVTSQPRWYDALVIGFFQVCAIFPGISRSGSTIAAARYMGWSRHDAARFSFLLAIPTILGGCAVEAFELFTTPNATLPLPLYYYLVGFITSWGVGWATLSIFMHFIRKQTLKPFAWYCAVIGIFSLLYLNKF